VSRKEKLTYRLILPAIALAGLVALFLTPVDRVVG
jgi:hypothetical protein